MNARLSLSYVIGTAAVLGLMFFLDGLGTFIYFTYVPAYALVLLGIALGLLAAGKTRVGRPELIVFGAASAILVVAALALPRLQTSPRKGFFLASMSLRPGMTISEVKSMLRPFDQSPHFWPPSTYSFGYASGPGTTDVVVVRCDARMQRVISAEYSPD